MTITLSPEMEHYVAERIVAGEFETPSQVIEEALLMFRAQEEDPVYKAELISKLQVGLDDIKAGRVVRTTALEIQAKVREQKSRSPNFN